MVCSVYCDCCLPGVTWFVVFWFGFGLRLGFVFCWFRLVMWLSVLVSGLWWLCLYGWLCLRLWMLLMWFVILMWFRELVVCCERSLLDLVGGLWFAYCLCLVISCYLFAVWIFGWWF